jgi:redox-sensing transcriptional repressor
MSIKPPPPDIVIGRLPIYLRALDALARENNDITSSYELGERLGISSAQIRKDLSHFGDFGKQGTGYNISFLIDQLRDILKVNREWNVVILGAGHVGMALANYHDFTDHGFKLVGIFDSDAEKIGQRAGELIVQNSSEAPTSIRKYGAKIAMIATPGSVAQDIADMLVAADVQSILCYAPTTLIVPEGVHIQYIDPVTKLQHMTYYIKE